MDEQLSAIYHRHVGTAFDRQMRLAAFLDKKDAGEEWEYDHTTATLRFGKVTFEAPILGSHAHNNHSWLWAWSNKHLKLTLTNRALGDTVRATWHHLGVHTLGAIGFAIEPFLGVELTESAVHILGVILSRELGYDAYFVVPDEGSEAVLLIRDDRLKFTEKHPLVRIAMEFPRCLRGMPVLDHKAALTAYARDYGLTVTEQSHVLKITDGGKDELTATFDSLGRLTNLEGIELPAPTPAKKPAAKKKPAKVKAKAKAATKKKPVAKAAAKNAPAKKPVAKATAGKKPAAKKAAVAKKPAKKATGKK
ncbi:MAG: hypothetical protein U0792_03555 [Gemmataceae bacterium]